MSAPNFDEVVGGLASQGIAVLKATLAEAWDSLTEEERQACLTLITTLAKARLYEIAGRDVSAYLPTLEAAFMQWKVVGKQVVASAIRSAATEVLGLGGAFVGGLLSSFIKAAI